MENEQSPFNDRCVDLDGIWRAELLNSIWTDIDFKTMTTSVSPKKNSDEMWEWLIKVTDRRTLPLTEELAFLLLEHQNNPPLWRFHNVHHMDPDLDVSTSFRFHFVEILYYMPPIGEVAGQCDTCCSDFTVIRLHGPDRQALEDQTGGLWDKVVESKNEGLASAVSIVRKNDTRLTLN